MWLYNIYAVYLVLLHPYMMNRTYTYWLHSVANKQHQAAVDSKKTSRHGSIAEFYNIFLIHGDDYLQP